MKHKFIAKRYWKDQSTAMGQSDVLAKAYDDVIDLSLGDPDLITHPLIIEKAFEDAKAGGLQDQGVHHLGQGVFVVAALDHDGLSDTEHVGVLPSG